MDAALLGQVSLGLTLALCVHGLFASVAGGVLGRDRWVLSGGRALHGILFFLTVAMVVLGWAFYVDDFSLKYVAGHSAVDQPRVYAVTAIWGGMEGSLLLWSWILAIFSVVSVEQNRRSLGAMMPGAQATFAGVNLFFIILMVSNANPFASFSLVDIPVDGRGLNPLLQNPGMVIHPPMLYLGFVGTTVPFAFALGALASGDLGPRWIQNTRRWALVTWAFLGIGILLGGRWAYEELGWGGYWAWDPVENASFMPWLTGTAYLHSVMIQEKRGMLKVWNMVLVFLTFWLSIFGTFLTRSGFIQSVHTFAQSPIGWWFLVFLFVVVLPVFVRLMWIRRESLRSEHRLESALSRESAFLYQNWLFLAACFIVFLGTVGEPISRAITGISTTFRAPYYNTLEIPLFITILFLAGIGPLISWRRASVSNLRRNFVRPAVCGVVGGGIVGWVCWWSGQVGEPDRGHFYALLTVMSAIFSLSTVVTEFSRGVAARRRAHGETVSTALSRLMSSNRRRYGGYVVHIGMAAIFVGVAGTSLDLEKEALLGEGDSLYVGDFELRYVGTTEVERSNHLALKVEAELYRNGVPLVMMNPERRVYRTQDEQPTTEVAIHQRFLEDVYVLPAGWNERGAVIKVHINRLVGWVWAGGWIFAFGALLAMWPEGKRRVSGA